MTWGKQKSGTHPTSLPSQALQPTKLEWEQTRSSHPMLNEMLQRLLSRSESIDTQGEAPQPLHICPELVVLARCDLRNCLLYSTIYWHVAIGTRTKIGPQHSHSPASDQLHFSSRRFHSSLGEATQPKSPHSQNMFNVCMWYPSLTFC